MSNTPPVLVTSAGGQTGSIGRTIVRGLLDRGLPVSYVPSTMDDFRKLLRTLAPGIPDHVALHLENLAMQNAGDRYIAEVTDDVERLLGRPATPFKTVLEAEAWRFEKGTPNHIQHREVKDLNPERAV